LRFIFNCPAKKTGRVVSGDSAITGKIPN
jgi:hypothetical protein